MTFYQWIYRMVVYMMISQLCIRLLPGKEFQKGMSLLTGLITIYFVLSFLSESLKQWGII